LASNLSHAFTLKEVGRIDIDAEAQVYGLHSGNIVIEEKERLLFLDRRYQVRAEIAVDSGHQVLVADNGLYYAFIDRASGGDDSADTRVTVYDNRQRPLWGAADLMPGRYFLSPSGDYLAVITGHPRWYDNELVIFHRDRPLANYKIEFFSGIVFSPDGEYLFIDAGPKGSFMFTGGGRLMGQYGPQSSYAFTGESDRLVLFRQGMVRIYDGDEEKVAIDLKKINLSDMIYSESESRLVLAYSDVMKVVDRFDGSVVWEVTPERSGGSFVSIDISPDSRFIAAGVDINLGSTVEGHLRHVRGFLHVYDIDGRAFDALEFRYERYFPGLPEVVFAPDQRSIFVRNRESLHIVELR